MDGFQELYDRHWRDVYRFALFLCGNPAQAEDLASDTFMRAWTARGPIREATVRAYLLTIARNLWRDMKRREARLVPLEDAAVPAAAAVGDAVLDLAWVERQLALVPDGDGRALLLHARDGLSYEEIARRLDISVGAVKSRIFRARAALHALRERAHTEGDRS